jgi:sugar lactone lactonase YvrE
LGDDGPATSAHILPRGVAVDTSGQLFIADQNNNRIRRVITTVAGGGTGGLGDGGPATSAQLKSPLDVALDASGRLYIADALSHRIRRVRFDVDGAGTITIVAGSGASGFSGDGGPATSAQLNSLSGVAVDASGRVYIADTGNNRIRRVTFDENGVGIITTGAGTGTRGFRATTDLRRARGSISLGGLQWMRRAASSSLTSQINASE